MAQAKTETKLETTLERLSSTYEMTFEYAQSQKAEIDIVEAREQVVILRREVSSLGNVDLDVPQEYKKASEHFKFLNKQRGDPVATKDKILETIDEMDNIMVKQFQEIFDKINTQLSDIFHTLSGGGKARLFMVDPEDVLNIGIDIDVQPLGRTVQNIRLFNSGEKGLIAICVLSSILKTRTMPLCIFDEVEAVLDRANVERFAKHITQFHGESQFVVVAHRLGAIAQCDVLYKVTIQQNGVSQLLKMKLQDAINMTGKEEVKT